MNGLRSQLNRLNKKKLDVTKKSHFGSQTIALGPVVQRPYDSRAFELGQSEFEKENNELKARLKALEDSFELLKQKRISDLQALHKVHEKEMSKLVTELQVEVALSKSLYAVLKNDSREANLFELWQKFR
ncbi:hypothetical protein RUM43_003718 [Polyplax serrata]|uniref:Uncharacterized protein n=1 Tax=Polyplax serrata TaxID=468196 RepID=A0AAN8PFY4_POLSC